MPSTQPITQLLQQWQGGDTAALEALTPLVYEELRKLAASYLQRERQGHTLEPTALVHEAYLRLVDQAHQSWENRSHFFSVAAHLMRLILVDWARKRSAEKRGGGAEHVQLDAKLAIPGKGCDDLLALDEALTELSSLDPRKTDIIERRYFAGMTIDEVAQNLGISTATVEREMRVAQLWLNRKLKGSGP